ncbi:MAG TPA: type III pantothenate kinase [Puia sp.]|nr:type III pantothenate kinase [Puia sp.]
MPTTLCFDFGNTRMKCAVFTDGTLQQQAVLGADPEQAVSLLLDQFQPTRTILSSVIDHPPGIEALLRSRSRFHRLDHSSKLPITTPVSKPDSIGADRLALTAAAVSLFPGKNNLVIGLGSAVTYNFVNKYCEFLGGGISPGMEMRFRSLHEFTAKLPLVKPDWNLPLVGYDTRTNILSGVILGMAKEIDGTIGAYEEKYDNFNVLMSGGDAAYFTGRLKKEIFVDPDLIFKGLYAISELNA